MYYSALCIVCTDDSDQSMKKEFLQEIAMMKRVSTGKNPYVVNMIGCCSVQEPLALVLELVPNGNLLEYLKANRTLVRSVFFMEKC